MKRLGYTLSLCALPILCLAASPTGSAHTGLDLWRAIEFNDVATVRRLAEAKLSLDTEIIDGDTALMRAAFKGRVEIVEMLIKYGASPTASNRLGKTPLMAACEGSGDDALVLVLLTAGADPKAIGYNGETAYLYAARYRRPMVLTLLEKSGADPMAKDRSGRGALFWAAYQSNKPVIRYLLDKGAKVNEPDKDGATPLLVARKDSVRMILLDSGADPSVRDHDGGSVLTRALSGYGRIADVGLLQRLIEGGADVNIKDGNGSTPLMYAAWFGGGDEQIVRILLARGARVNAVDRYGRTALMQTIKPAIGAALLDSGADLAMRDQSGHTALWFALRLGDKGMAELLRQRGAKE